MEEQKEIRCPDCNSKVKYYHNPGVTRIVCSQKCNGFKVIKEIDHRRKVTKE